MNRRNYAPRVAWGPLDGLRPWRCSTRQGRNASRIAGFQITQGYLLMKKTLWLASTAIVAAAMISAPAYAGGKTKQDTRDQEIQELKARLDRLERESEDEKIVAGSRLNKVEETQSAEPVWTFTDGRPTVRSGDGKIRTDVPRPRPARLGVVRSRCRAIWAASFDCGGAADNPLCDLGVGRRVPPRCASASKANSSAISSTSCASISAAPTRKEPAPSTSLAWATSASRISASKRARCSRCSRCTIRLRRRT